MRTSSVRNSEYVSSSFVESAAGKWGAARNTAVATSGGKLHAAITSLHRKMKSHADNEMQPSFYDGLQPKSQRW